MAGSHPLHFWVKAANARFTAHVLWSLDEEAQRGLAEQIGYDGATSIALREAFEREASLSLELAIKAVVAQRIEAGRARVTKVKTTHDLVLLWSHAELPPLPRDDRHRLLIAKSILLWSGRYATPRNDEVLEKERKDMAPLEDIRPFGSTHFIRMRRSFTWEDVDRIYQVAARSLAELRAG